MSAEISRDSKYVLFPNVVGFLKELVLKTVSFTLGSSKLKGSAASKAGPAFAPNI